jgi:DNA-binding XRE family transcriptional regulator
MNGAVKAKSLGQTLRKWRQGAGLMQQTVAAIIGVKASHVMNIEQSKREPSLPLLLESRLLLTWMCAQRSFSFHPETKNTSW